MNEEFGFGVLPNGPILLQILDLLYCKKTALNQGIHVPMSVIGL